MSKDKVWPVIISGAAAACVAFLAFTALVAVVRLCLATLPFHALTGPVTMQSAAAIVVLFEIAGWLLFRKRG